MTTTTPKRAPRAAALTARHKCALAFAQGLLSGPAGVTVIKGNGVDPMVKLSRLSLKFADAFLAESAK